MVQGHLALRHALQEGPALALQLSKLACMPASEMLPHLLLPVSLCVDVFALLERYVRSSAHDSEALAATMLLRQCRLLHMPQQVSVLT